MQDDALSSSGGGSSVDRRVSTILMADVFGYSPIICLAVRARVME